MSDVHALRPVSDRPLAISLLLGVSGWVAGLFLLVFVALLIRPEDPAPAAALGIVLLGAAWVLFLVDRDGDAVFLGQLGLALAIAGQCLVLWAVAGLKVDATSVTASALVLEVALAWLMPNRLSRVLSILFATVAWALTMRFAIIGEPEDWSHGHARGPVSLMIVLAGWLATWLPVMGALWWAVRNEPSWRARGWTGLTAPLLTGLVAGLAFATLLSEPFENDHWFGSGEAATPGLALWPLLSALGALGALVAAFALRRRALAATCAVAALLHVGHFYWALGTSLLVKSLVMLVMGAGLLAAARLLRPKEQT